MRSFDVRIFSTGSSAFRGGGGGGTLSDDGVSA